MRESAEWSVVWSVPVLGAADVHLWRGRFAADSAARPVLEQHLSEDEREHAARFRFEPDRRRYVVARGMLRRIVACYVAVRPDKLRFHYEKHGRPVLMAQPERCIDFNVSHSGELIVIAVARARKVGVDVEKVRPDIEAVKIAERFFSPDEVRMLLSLPDDQRAQAFFRCWTRKEAYLKARGEGLAVALDSFDVTLGASGSARFTRGVDPSWQLLGFEAGCGYPAALAYNGGPAHVLFLAADLLLER
jgi:4'-phosphopantetheinyl transferase